MSKQSLLGALSLGVVGIVVACDGEPGGPAAVPEIDGVWDFVESLVISSQLAVCSDTGSMRFDLEGGSLSGSGVRVGMCEGLVGGFPVATPRLVMTAADLRDSTVSFTIEHGCGCIGDTCTDARYLGVVRPGPPARIVGTSACSVNYNGTWEAWAAGGVVSLELATDSATMVVGETIRLSTVLRDSSGRRVFERELSWQSSDSDIATVSDSGAVTALDAGTVSVAATFDGMSDEAALEVGYVDLVSVSAGSYHTCGLSAGGNAHCWGANDWSQAGFGQSLHLCPGVPCRRAPALVSPAISFARLSLGFVHSCGLGTDDFVYCWGSNTIGQMGRDLAFASSPEPLAVAGNHLFSAIGSGANHSCAVTDQGAALCWGHNNRAQLGNHEVSFGDEPIEVYGGLVFRSISGGEWHTCALTLESRPYCWGWNWFGQLGVDSTPGTADPVPVSGDLRLQSLSSGSQHTCGLDLDGVAHCWGRGLEGQLGVDHVELVTEPVAVSGGLFFQSLSSGGRHTCAVAHDGTAYCWGEGAFGRLGNGSEARSATPVPVSGAEFRFTYVTAGFEHTCGLTTDGSVYCWGSNFAGQLGILEISPSTSPQLVLGQR
jgi:alpha-tubulin suppressor-like RCC1 family protein